MCKMTSSFNSCKINTEIFYHAYASIGSYLKGHFGLPTEDYRHAVIDEFLCIMAVCALGPDKDKDKDLFIGPQEFVVGYSQAPEQQQSSARPICHSHTMSSSGREPATISIAAYRSSPRYTLCHGR